MFLFRTTGLVLLEQGDTSDQLEIARKSMERNQVPHEWLNADQLIERYPMAR